MQKVTLYIIASVLFIMTACEPSVEDKIDIGLPPAADFSIEFIDENNVRLTNTSTDDNFLSSWNVGDGTITTDEGGIVEVSYPIMGEYFVTLTVFGKGGSGDVTKVVNITQDAPSACIGLKEFLTDCTSKIWKLNPDDGALWVGPNDGTGTTWWQSSANDAISRPCDWNDEYIFAEDGVYTYDSKGDMWGESYSGFSMDACYPITDLSADRAAWADGTHSFEIISGTPEKLKVIGNGAFVGLRKAANGAEVTLPQAEVTYDVIRWEKVANGQSFLELEINYGGGLWRFTLINQ